MSKKFLLTPGARPHIIFAPAFSRPLFRSSPEKERKGNGCYAGYDGSEELSDDVFEAPVRFK